ncbi:hypothetical protein TSOC_007266 [Tetrabaena socialis]|uniref:Uncharacterized protein n=1 Tax=Tetrabaena socialis TaxID=47790 RepID=A0A2J8A1F8_9CHLO|nr:hypothetical protein TSOC_007266 [Tetrabaena socialis]|eukprot:PNH06357.1 hypothetical protein TSOC_007266 [Tetrabaena socialis]
MQGSRMELFRASGTREQTAPMLTEITVMTESALTLPKNDIHRPIRIARRAAMKNVLSPISETKMREKAARKPDLPSGPLNRTSCTSKGRRGHRPSATHLFESLGGELAPAADAARQASGLGPYGKLCAAATRSSVRRESLP